MANKPIKLHDVRHKVSSNKLSTVGESLSFPKKIGFTSVRAIAEYHRLMVGYTYEADTEAYMQLADNTTHLGDAYLEYILLNISDYAFIYKEQPRMEIHLRHSKALTKLIAVNIWRQHEGHDYSLPPILSRKFLNIKEALIHYMKNNETITLTTFN